MENTNSKFKSQNSTLFNRGFTLVELIIVVSILGILAAIVLPEFQGHAQQAKETAAKDNLRILRTTIERYAFDHNEVPPGYPDNDPTQTPGSLFVTSQLTIENRYLSEMPENPFNGYSTVYIVAKTGTVTDGMAVGSAQGWVYQPSTKTVKLNYSGTDSEGNNYFDY